MLDFCFLADRDKYFFLFKYFDRFRTFCFFLEIELADGTFLTIRRSVENHSKISFKRHQLRNQDYSGLPVEPRPLVEDIDQWIADLNEARYSLSQSRRKVTSTLKEDAVVFDPDQAARLFKEAGILFEGQIKWDFEQLVDFNKAIAEERRAYREIEKAESDSHPKEINSELAKLGKKRAESLSFLSETDALEKYKIASRVQVESKAEILALERQRSFIARLQDLRKAIRTLSDELRDLQALIESDTENQNADATSLFSAIRLHFCDIAEGVIGLKDLLICRNQDLI